MARTVSGSRGTPSPQLNPAETATSQPLFGSRQELGRRETLEDRLHVANIRTAAGLPMTIAMIADGVGGAAFGERAAEIAIEAAFQTFVSSLTADPRTIPLLLRQGLEQAQRAVLAEQRADKAKREMGTTAVAVAIHNNSLYLANVGDSRAYLMRDGKLHQLTRDHSWGLEMLREGLLRDAEEAARHPKANELYRSVGEEENFKVDLGIYLNGVEQEDAAMANQGLQLMANDRLLVCSDGLVRDRPTGGRYIDDEEIVRILNTRAPDAAAAELVERAIGRRADDNVSAIVLEMPGSKRAFALPSWFRYAAMGAGTLLLIAVILLLLVRNPENEASAVEVPLLPTMALSTAAPPMELAAGSSEDVRVIDNGIETASGWPLLDDGTPAVIASGIGAMQLRFAEGSDLYLAPDTEVALARNDDGYRVRIDRGEIVFHSSTTTPVYISNRVGSWVRVQEPDALVGVTSLVESSIEFVAHCLTATCELKGDLADAPMRLLAGEAGRVGGSGVPEAAGAADYARFNALAAVVPTPTATTTAEPTQTPTDTPVPTATPTRRLGVGGAATPTSPPASVVTASPEATDTPGSNNPPPKPDPNTATPVRPEDTATAPPPEDTPKPDD